MLVEDAHCWSGAPRDDDAPLEDVLQEPRSVLVDLFGKRVKAVEMNGSIMFDRASFVSVVGKACATRIFEAMDEAFSFLGQDGVDTLVADGKEYLLCQLVLADKNSPDELHQYAMAWVSAYELLRGECV